MPTPPPGTPGESPDPKSHRLYWFFLIALLLGGYHLHAESTRAEAARIAKRDLDDRRNPYTVDQHGCTWFDGESASDLVSLLQEERIEELATRVDRMQKAVEKDVRCDRFIDWPLQSLAKAVKTAGDRQSELMGILSRWTESEPDSYIPWMLRGRAYEDLGYQARGTGLSSDTSDEQWEGMRKNFASATGDFDRTLALNPRAIGAYFGLLEIARANGSKEEAVRLLDDALAVDLSSYRLFKYYMDAVDPRWGGDFDLIQIGIERARPYIPNNPTLRIMLGHPHHVRALQAKRNERHEEAAESWLKALQYAKYYEWHKQRGQALQANRDFESSIKEFDNVLAQEPQMSTVWRYRGRSNMAIGHIDEAIQDFTHSIEHNDGSRRPYQDRGWANDRAGRYEEAIADLYHAASMFEKPSEWTLKKLGEIIYYDLKRYDEAEKVYAELLEWYPQGTFGWYRYGMTLHHQGKLEAKDALEYYLSVVDTSDPSNKSNITETRQVLGITDTSEKNLIRTLPGLASAVQRGN